MSLFSSFNPYALGLPLNWISTFFCVLLLANPYWYAPSQFSSGLSLTITAFTKEFKTLLTKGAPLVSVTLFAFLIFNNFLGLFPYIFTSSTHFPFSLGMALPLWAGHMLLTVKNVPGAVLAHLVPSGTPTALAPFMVLIEFSSNLIRPLTLSIRLTANMIAGHLILTLLGSQVSPSAGAFASSAVMLVVILILLLESAVAVIQAYVFTVLSTLYLKDWDNKTNNSY